MGCLLQEQAVPPPLDVIGGCAGAIGPLLALARRPGLGHLAQVAVRCGEAICRGARWEGGLCRWEPTDLHGQTLPSPPVTGFAHGASGLALALVALYAQTGDERCRETARGAFAWEDRLYSQADRNWIDTRSPYVQEEGRVAGTCQAAWCHGAPGIALARRLAATLDLSLAGEVGPKATVALETTVVAMGQRLRAPGIDATLCHGIAGLAEILLTCGEASHKQRRRRRRWNWSGGMTPPAPGRPASWPAGRTPA